MAAALPFDIYVRVSRTNGRKDDGARFISPDVQEKKCRTQAEADGREIGQVFTDLDQSGGKASRPEFDRMMARIAEGESGGVYVFDLSRFGRSTRNVLDGIDLIESAGAQFISCAEKIDTGTSGGRFMLTIFAALRQMEREQSAEKWKTATGNAIERGAYVGRTPVGYDRLTDGRLVKNEHAPVVKLVFERRVSGWSWAKLAEMLEEQGVKSATGMTVWNINSVRSMVQHPIYKGTMVNGTTHHFPEYAIVAPSVWESAQEHKGVQSARRDGGVWALCVGLVFCAECDGPMTPQRDVRETKTAGQSIYLAYRCQNRKCKAALGKQVRVKGDELDALVAEGALAEYARRIAEVGLGSDEDVARVTELEQELEGAESELAGFLAVVKSSSAGFAEAVAEREAVIEQWKATITEEQAKTRRFPPVEEIRAVLESCGLDEKREAVRRVIDSVNVSLIGRKLTPEAAAAPVDFNREFDAADYEPSTALVDRIETVWS